MEITYAIKCSGHNYVSLYWGDKFIHCYDNNLEYMEDIIAAIEKRTQMQFRDIPRMGDIRDFDGLRFLNGGFKKGAQIFA